MSGFFCLLSVRNQINVIARSEVRPRAH